MEKTMVSQFIQGALHFLDEYFENKNITKQEILSGKFFVRQIFNKDQNHDLDLSNLNYGQLIKITALASRFPRCADALEYLMENFQQYIHPYWGAYYNLIFIGTHFINGVSSQDTIPQVKYRKNYDELQPQKQCECYNLAICVMEIYCLTQILRTQIYNNINVSIQNLYNFLDKFNILFRDLFQFRIADTSISLNPYRRLRHAIAHSHFIIQGDQIKFVDWDYSRHPRTVNGMLNYNVTEITEEMLYLCVIISQIVALYQLMQQ